MCEETGIGSGTLYYDETLFSTHKEADVEAKKICDAQTKNVARNNFKGKYDFADKLGTFGYRRSEALIENKRMNRWLDRIKDA